MKRAVNACNNSAVLWLVIRILRAVVFRLTGLSENKWGVHQIEKRANFEKQ